MKMPVPSGYVALLTIVAIVVLLTAPHSSMAAPAGFELDLKELKKPATPLLPPQKQQPSAAPKKARQQAPAKTAAKKPAPARTTKQAASNEPAAAPAVQSSYTVASGDTLFGILTRYYHLPPEAANRLVPTVVAQNQLADASSISVGQRLLFPLAEPAPSTAAAASPRERTVQLQNDTACDVAQQLLTVLATPLPVERALHGIAIPAVAAARRHDTTTVLACGLPAAEAYTFTRLLEADNVRLISLHGDEPPAQVVQTVAHHLGLSFRQKQEHPLSYLTTDPQGDPLLVLVGNGAAP